MTEAARRITVLLVDDHPIVRTGYRTLLAGSPEVEVIAEAENGTQACSLYAELRPDVVVMDLTLPGMSGLEATQRIVQREPEAAVLVFSMHEHTIFVERALQAGARGYITKDSAPEVLEEAVVEVAGGRPFIDHKLAQTLAIEKSRGLDNPLSALSAREFEVFCLLANGHGPHEIAERLSLSYKSVANYRTQVKRKLDVDTSADLLHLALKLGIVSA